MVKVKKVKNGFQLNLNEEEFFAFNFLMDNLTAMFSETNSHEFVKEQSHPQMNN